MRKLVIISLFVAIPALASLRIIDADQIRSSNRSSVWSFPNSTDSLVGMSVSQTLSNKTIPATANTISGLSNTNLSGSAAISNANLAAMANSTVKGNVSGGSATPSDLTMGQISAALTSFVGDSGTGGVKGAVPAPAAGDAAANKFLKADGTWATAGTSAHSGLTGLTTGDDHTQYAYLAGRSSGQVLNGGLNSGGSIVILSNPNKDGKVYLGSTTYPIVIDQNTGYMMWGGTAPSLGFIVKNVTDSYAETLGVCYGGTGTGCSSNIYSFYVSPGSTFYLRNNTQTYSYMQALSTGQISLGGANATVGYGILAQNQSGKTTDVSQENRAIASQTADLHRWSNSSGTAMAKIDINGGASVQKINVGTYATHGGVLAYDSARGAFTGSTVAIPACVAISASDVDWSQGNCFTKTLSANTAFTFTNKVPGQTIILRVTNPSSYTWTLPNTNTQGNSVLWAGSVIPSASTSGKKDIVTIFYDGTEMYGNAVQNFGGF